MNAPQPMIDFKHRRSLLTIKGQILARELELVKEEIEQYNKEIAEFNAISLSTMSQTE